MFGKKVKINLLLQHNVIYNIVQVLTIFLTLLRQQVTNIKKPTSISTEIKKKKRKENETITIMSFSFPSKKTEVWLQICPNRGDRPEGKICRQLHDQAQSAILSRHRLQ